MMDENETKESPETEKTKGIFSTIIAAVTKHCVLCEMRREQRRRRDEYIAQQRQNKI